jgi:hypothetical protein
MKQKNFTKRQVKIALKRILKTWKNRKLDGQQVSLKGVIGDYTNISMYRYIKEVLFYGDMGSYKGRCGAIWYLKYPKKSMKKLTKKVMKAKNVTQ